MKAGGDSEESDL